jgi:DNA polymerase (family 10)
LFSTEHPDKVQQQLLNIPNKVKDVAVGQTKVSLELTYDDETIILLFNAIFTYFFISRFGHLSNANIMLFRTCKMLQHFGSEWIAPALREDGSEFDKDLSQMITLDDINGMLINRFFAL